MVVSPWKCPKMGIFLVIFGTSCYWYGQHASQEVATLLKKKGPGTKSAKSDLGSGFRVPREIVTLPLTPKKPRGSCVFLIFFESFGCPIGLSRDPQRRRTLPWPGESTTRRLAATWGKPRDLEFLKKSRKPLKTKDFANLSRDRGTVDAGGFLGCRVEKAAGS